MTFIHLSKRGFNKVGHTIISLKPRDFEALIDLKNVVNSASPAQATPMQSLNVYGSMDRVLQKITNMRWVSVCIHNVSETMNLGIRKIKRLAYSRRHALFIQSRLCSV